MYKGFCAEFKTVPFKTLLLFPGVEELHISPNEKKENKTEDIRFVHFLGYSKVQGDLSGIQNSYNIKYKRCHQSVWVFI